jgi:hypothetical protein
MDCLSPFTTYHRIFQPVLVYRAHLWT